MKKKLNPALWIGGGFLWLAALALSPTFQTNDEAPQVVTFVAQHSLGPVDGTLQPVRGTLTFDPAAPANGLSGRFTVDMASFDTGLGLRDRDMRKNYLEVETYPEAVLTLEGARPTSLTTSGDTLRWAVTGTLTLHGTTHALPMQAWLVPANDGYEVEAAFTIHLPDYNIKQPKRFFMSVDNDVEVRVQLFLIP